MSTTEKSRPERPRSQLEAPAVLWRFVAAGAIALTNSFDGEPHEEDFDGWVFRTHQATWDYGGKSYSLKVRERGLGTADGPATLLEINPDAVEGLDMHRRFVFPTDAYVQGDSVTRLHKDYFLVLQGAVDPQAINSGQQQERQIKAQIKMGAVVGNIEELYELAHLLGKGAITL